MRAPNLLPGAARDARAGFAIVVALIVSCMSATALAQDAEEAPPPRADEHTRRVAEGIRQATGGEVAAAGETFRAAIALDEARPSAIYYAAVVDRMQNRHEEALAGFRRAVEVARAADEPRWTARALMAVAFTLERLGESRYEDARAAWVEYLRFAESRVAVSHPSTAPGRNQAIDAQTEQARAYVAVRERIAERERIQAEAQDSSSRPSRRQR